MSDQDIEAFRSELRSWLADNIPDELRLEHAAQLPEAERIEQLRAWQATLAAARWVGITWPNEYGGRGASIPQQIAYTEEMARAEAPQVVGSLGIGIAGPPLIAYGTEEQKQRFARRILTAEDLWCFGFSEPGAGSDLASLRTLALLDGDHFVVNGQKVWTTLAQHADWCMLLCRTDPQAKRRAGISCLLVDMKSPGITVRPLRQISGHAEFNEVFFENVRVPRELVVGEIDRGWEISLTTLNHERGANIPYQRLRQMLEGLLVLSRRRSLDGPLAADPLVRQELAQLAIDIEVLRASTYRNVFDIMRTGQPGPGGSMLKLFWSELEQRLMQVAVSLAGPYGALDEHAPQAFDEGRWQYGVLWSRAASIYAGTSEVQRNIMAQRVLGLPRG